MMEHLEFSFVPFGRDIKVNSLDKLLDVFDSENLLQHYTLVQYLFQHEEHKESNWSHMEIVKTNALTVDSYQVP